MMWKMHKPFKNFTDSVSYPNGYLAQKVDWGLKSNIPASKKFFLSDFCLQFVILNKKSSGPNH